MTFESLGLIAPILTALRDLGYEAPSPIQEKAIPPALAGRDVLGCAQTGTGKTCAFASPILQLLNSRPVKGKRPVRALILTPTRELALQIQESFEAYGKNLPLRSAVIFGGVGQQPQVDRLKAGVDILVATPGRLEDLHNQGYIHVENLEIFVLDEADRMLDMGFIHDVKKILTWLPRKKQTLFFSATMPPEVRGLVDSLLTDPVKVAVNPVSSPVEVIDQKLYYVDRANKSRLLASLILKPQVKNALIFTRTKHGANKVAADLEKSGIHSAAIHGNKSQTARQQALADFKAGRVKALVATDIAARGIDIEELTHVFNYNLPDVPETYVHRIGRTGRAGHGGTAVSFCEFGEKDLLAPIEKLLKKPIPVVEDHPWPMEVLEAPKRDKHGKIINADDAEARQAARERKKLRDAARREAAAKEKEEKPAAQEPAREKQGLFGRKKKGKAPQPPVQEAAPAPKKQPRQKKNRQEPVHAPAQTAASGKRASAGYKPSKTLEEAIAAMEPHYTEAEKAAQAQYYRDPLAGDVIMDATARLLAPRKPMYSHDHREDRQERRDEGRRRKPGKQTRQPHQEQNQLPKMKKTPKTRQPVQQTGKAKKLPQEPVKNELPKALAPKKRKNRGPRGPMEVPLRLGNQKDSTERQDSLMKPYYFNPNED